LKEEAMTEAKDTQAIRASNGFVERAYNFKLISTMNGLILWHEYASVLISAMPTISKMFKKFFEIDDGKEGVIFRMAKQEAIEGGGSGPLMDFITLIPHIVTTPRLIGLCKTLLAGAKIEDSECDDEGMCELFRGDPLEVYAALFWAIAANFPKYIDPLLEALSVEGEEEKIEDSSRKDGIQGSKRNEKTKKK
jgi:hypothetical protein